VGHLYRRVHKPRGIDDVFFCRAVHISPNVACYVDPLGFS